MEPRERLLSLIDDVNQKHIDDYVSFLSQSNTPDEFKKLMRAKGGFGAGYHQLIGPLVRRIYERDARVRNEIHDELRKFGVPDEFIQDYFTEGIQTGSLGVHLVLEETMPVEKRNELVERINQLMLDHLKNYVGLNKKHGHSV